jgi:ppGpp synthetase/RelA/SpoT-type nucleotidyltranferase
MDLETYSRSRHADYATLAETVASILLTAIKAYPGTFRLQQVQHRAKNPDSLKKKLEDRNLLSTTTLEDDIKDLAGRRLIFYTNSDVSRFLQTGIIQENFDVDWDRTKIHYPVPGKSEPDNLFISNNYVVKLKANRTSLPEYARFEDLACEVQIQTTLNHAWSEMEHDILYKRPKFEGFGGKLFEAIQRRLQTIMKSHLLPAGYEFQKAVDDYERLMSGKAILDRGALKTLVDCSDNNARLELLERFRDYVLPNYDNPESVYPEIKKHVVAAVIRRDVREEVEFVVRVLSSYRGQPFLYETCKEIVRTLAPDDTLLSNVQIILESTGVVSGEFGFVEAYKEKREALLPWLSDAGPKVQSFAKQYIGSLDRQIAAQQRWSEEDVEMRKRMYDNPQGDVDKS